VNFTELGIEESIVSALERLEYKEATEIQAQAIPCILAGNDVIALAETGSGKTAACAIPACQKVDTANKAIQVLIVVPTRELALQYATETQKIGRNKRIKSFAIYGGEDAGMQLSKLNHGVHVLVATPGRLIDFIYSRSINLDNVTTLVIDEADEMLSMGFADDLEFIMQCLVQEHQTLLFSATMPKSICAIAKNHMKSPKEITLTSTQASPKTIDHHFLFCHFRERENHLSNLLKEENPGQAIIFCHSRFQVEDVCKNLRREMGATDYLHGGLGQSVRTTITNKFRQGKIRFLVATDVAARGLDFSNVSHVFNFQISDDIDSYVHRSGRTGRTGRDGKVITLITQKELYLVSRILTRVQREPQWIGNPPPPQGKGRPPRKPRYKK
jgi:ATP-dependent RNA helicase DeaD